ncbi:MAG TPA: efflux RND transporter periplasmic adaptor subunit [Xanthomonadaceae bacterium]|nr:efflux RND transporter periplasmic adaptor subunit [Xanthomonadaceae bacterium]
MRSHVALLPLKSPLLLAAALVFGLAACSDEPDAAAAGGPPGGMQLPVEVVTVAPQPLEGGLETVGSLRADESVVISPEVAGRITRIHFREGGRVNAGDPMFSLDGDTYRAALAEAQANLANSRSAAARGSQLNEEQLIARSDYDTLRAQQAVDQARVASASTALSKMTLRAPFSGQVGLREVSVGDFVSVGQDLVTLVRTDPIEVDFSVPETELARLRPGQGLQVQVDAFPGETFSGEVVAIDPVIDIGSRSVQVRARIANPDGRLRPGQFARLQLQARDDVTALLIPEQALMQQGEERFVYTVVDGKAKRVVVDTGARVPGLVEVTSGLQAGDVVITAGQGKPMFFEGIGVMVVPTGEADKQPAPAGAAVEAADDGEATDEAAPE